MTTITRNFRQITEQPAASAPRFFVQDCRAFIADEQYWDIIQTS